MIGQHSTYLEVGRCCSAETRQPDSPRPSTSASSCNRFDFARPLVSTVVYAALSNRAGVPTGFIPLVGTSGMKILERNRTNSRRMSTSRIVVDEVEEGVFAGSGRFPPCRVQPTRRANFSASSFRGKLRRWRRGRVSRLEVTIIPPVSLAISPPPPSFSPSLRAPSFFRRRKSVHPREHHSIRPAEGNKVYSVGE